MLYFYHLPYKISEQILGFLCLLKVISAFQNIYYCQPISFINFMKKESQSSMVKCVYSINFL
jgi:hypothetical protein